MTTLYHPNADDLSIEVADDVVSDYVEQGWRKTDPAAKPTKSSSAASGDNK